MTKTTVRILSGAMIASLCLTACDGDYDLSKDINSNIKIGQNFRIPVGRTDTIYLERIIEESETVIDNNGVYEVTSTGSASSSVGPLESVTINNFAPTFSNVDISIPESGTFPSGSVISVDPIRTTGTYDIDEELPEEVEELYGVKFPDGEPVTTFLEINIPNYPNGVETVTFHNLTMTFPDFARLDNGTNLFIIDEVQLNSESRTMRYNVEIAYLLIDENEQNNYIKDVNERKHLIVSDDLIITAETSLTLSGEVTSQNFEVEFEYYVTNDVEVEAISGFFNTTANISTNITLNDIPDFLTTGSTSFSPEEVYMYIDLFNPVNTFGAFNLDMTSVKDNLYSSVSTHIDEIQPDMTNNILLCNFNADIDGYTTIENPNFVNLFQFVPDNIVIESDDLTLTSRDHETHMINLNEEYAVQADYQVVIPFRFSSLYIEYTDSIDNLLSDLEDVTDKTDCLIVTGTGITNIPVNMEASVRLFDYSGNEELTDSIDINLDNFRFVASTNDEETTNDLEISLTERVGSNALERLDKIIYTITSVNEEGSSNVVLRPKQYLLIKDIFVEIPDGIKISL